MKISEFLIDIFKSLLDLEEILEDLKVVNMIMLF